jgi:hypothetical protein
MKKTILFFCFVIHPFFAFSQTNIVSNGSFEEFEGSQIPFYVEQLKGWKLLKPTEAGYIHPKRKYFTPTKSAWGVQKAKEGKAYVFTKFGGKPVGGYHDFGDATRTIYKPNSFVHYERALPIQQVSTSVLQTNPTVR